MSSNPVAARLADLISVGVLTASVPRIVVDEAIRIHDRGAKRRGGGLPPHVMVYYAMAMALFAEDDYEGVFEQLARPLVKWGGWEKAWETPTSGGIAKARARLGFEPVKQVFDEVARPVAEFQTRGAFLYGRRLVSIDSMVFDLPETVENAAAFGRPSGGAFPQARVTTLVESGSHCSLGAVVGPVAGKGTGERGAARELLELLDEEMLLTADRGFYSFALWCAAADTGAGLLWRIGDTLDLPMVANLDDGSYTTLLFAPKTAATTRARLLERARAGEDLAEEAERCRLARVVEYQLVNRGPGPDDRELVCLLTTLTRREEAMPGQLAEAYHGRWEHEGANDEIKTQLRGPGKILRSKSPDLVRQEIYGYLLAHYALAALLCQAATETDTDPDRIKFADSLRHIRLEIADPAAFSP
ncbi:IS4 family transposase [Nonomuraea sp. NPDC004702]